MTVDYTKRIQKMNEEAAKKRTPHSADSAMPPVTPSSVSPPEQIAQKHIGLSNNLAGKKSFKNFDPQKPAVKYALLALIAIMAIYLSPFFAILGIVAFFKRDEIKKHIEEYKKSEAGKASDHIK